MIPVSLTLSGFTSFQEQVEIDFRPLVAARLFGIFGTVGAGKSSILEAITLALYGESARLTLQDRRSYNLLNLRSDRLWVDFVFSVAGPETEELYRFTVEAKRRKKRFDDTGTLKRNGYVRRDEEWVPLDHVDGARVLGLSYENFKRITIIPQGRFQEFLQLKPAERTRMLQELFDLDRFDLFARASSLYQDARARHEQLSGALAELGPGTTGELQGARERYQTLVADKALSVRKLGEARGIHEDFQRLQDRRERLQQFRAQQAALAEQQEAIEKLRTHVALIDLVQREFVPLLDRLNATAESDRLERERYDRAQAELVAAGENNQRGIEKRTALEGPVADLENKEFECNRLEAAYKVARFRIEREPLHLAHEAASQRHHETAQGLEATRLAEVRGRTRLETTGENLPERDTVARDRERASRAQSEMNTLRELTEQQHGELPTPDHLREELEHCRHAAARLDLDVHLASLVDSLTEGEPCPVCGSREHPRPLSADSERPEQLQKVRARITVIEETLKEQEHRRRAREAAVERLRSLLPKFDPDDPETQSAQVETFVRQVDSAYQRYQVHDRARVEVEQLSAEVLAAERKLAACARERDEAAGKLGRIDAVIDEYLPVLDEAGRRAAESRTPADIQADIETLRRKIRETREVWQQTLDQVARSEQVLSAAQARMEEVRHTTNAAREAYQQAQRALDERQGHYGLPDRSVLEAAYREIELLPSLRQQIVDFDQEQRSVVERIREIETELPERMPEEAEIAHARARVKELEAEVSLLDTNLGQLSIRIDTLAQEEQRRRTLTTHLETATVRRDNLQTLQNLFRGGGFVNYVAYVFLSDLVGAANKRFRRLTRNQLEIALRDDNEFEVVDFLNGGRRRSIKTLSGGQTFQAALCLALALVDSIDRGTGRRFFFLDEGFGSLDGDALREVFDTLKLLQQEERVVGIISHVELLQQEMDTFLLVSRDEERGSRVTCSWLSA